MSSSIQQIADDVLLMSFPWRLFGVNFKRNVTLMRLSDGRVVVHSTAKFSAEDVVMIRRFGEPAWLVDATLVHDTFAKEGRAALPNIPYLAPEGFTKVSGIPTQPLSAPPPDWAGEIDVLKLEGMRMKEHVFFHRRSRTLVAADLFLSFPENAQGWTRFFVHHFMGVPRMFGLTWFYRLIMIQDRKAFGRAMHQLVKFDFDRLVVAHWKPIETGAKPVVEQASEEFLSQN